MNGRASYSIDTQLDQIVDALLYDEPYVDDTDSTTLADHDYADVIDPLVSHH